MNDYRFFATYNLQRSFPFAYNFRYRAPYSKPGRAAQLKRLVENFIDHQDYSKAFIELIAAGWLRKHLHFKQKEQQEAVKEHASFFEYSKISDTIV